MKDIYSFNNNYEDIHKVIKLLIENHNLNEKEKGFIKNMKEYVIDNHGFMTDPQLEFLSNIWDKY